MTFYLNRLVRELGGHGNGISLMKDGEVILLKKGVNLSTKKITKIIKNTEFDWCIFHTRLASVGGKSDANCHPFECGGSVLAMNGTESEAKFPAQLMGITDSEAILRLCKVFNRDIVETVKKYTDSTFIGFDKGEPFVVSHKSYFSGIQCCFVGDAIIFASTLPSSFPRTKPSVVPFSWTPEVGDTFEQEEVKEYSSYSYPGSAYGYYGSRGYFDDGYDDGFDDDTAYPYRYYSYDKSKAKVTVKTKEVSSTQDNIVGADKDKNLEEKKIK